MNTTQDKRTALVAGLRALADDLENSTGPLPTHPIEAQWLIFGDENQKDTATSVVRSIGGHWDKDGLSDLFEFRRDYGGRVKARVVVDRPAVCERVVTDTKTITRHIPAQPAVEAHEVAEIVEQVEWRCQPLLADASEQVSA